MTNHPSATFFNAIVFTCTACVLLTLKTGFAQQSQWVRYGQSGLLQYQRDSRGDRIMDFSAAGYRNGEAIPDVGSVVANDRIINVAAGDGDDLQRIQDAIDQVSSFSLNENGFRGVVNLSAGEYGRVPTGINARHQCQRCRIARGRGRFRSWQQHGTAFNIF